MNATQESLEAAQSAFQSALVAQDLAKISSMVSPNFTVTGVPNRPTISRAEFLNGLEKGWIQYLSITKDQMQAVDFVSDASAAAGGAPQAKITAHPSRKVRVQKDGPVPALGLKDGSKGVEMTQTAQVVSHWSQSGGSWVMTSVELDYTVSPEQAASLASR